MIEADKSKIKDGEENRCAASTQLVLLNVATLVGVGVSAVSKKRSPSNVRCTSRRDLSVRELKTLELAHASLERSRVSPS